MMLMIFITAGCATQKENNISVYDIYPEASVIKLNTDSATVNNESIIVSDYTWRTDLNTIHDDVKNCPGEYYTGVKSDEDIYIDHDLVYYPELSIDGFTLKEYDGEREWVYHYQDGINNEFIYATLPSSGNNIPSNMMHSESEALKNQVLHINKEGTYILEGKWQGQIAVDTDEEKVTLIFNNVDVNCSVAPAFVVYSAYQSEISYEDICENRELLNSECGVQIILYEGTENTFTGQNIYRMLKTQYKNDSTEVQKKAHKIDSPFYSFVSMSISGSGKLTVNSSFEGMGTEMHLAVYDGNIVINSQDDGINVNEDNVSVAAFYGGCIEINAALATEGDGIDSNGYIVVDGAELNINNVRIPDNALDSEDGVLYNSGSILVDGEPVQINPGTYHSIDKNNGMMQNRPGFDQTEKNRPEFNDKWQGNMPNNGLQNRDFDINEFKKQVNELGDDATIMDVLRLLNLQEFFLQDIH